MGILKLSQIVLQLRQCSYSLVDPHMWCTEKWRTWSINKKKHSNILQSIVRRFLSNLKNSQVDT